jgi:hypothetical protein
MAHGNRVDLPRRHQPAQYFAHLAARRQGSQEQLNLFHARRNHGLQIDRSQYGDRRHLRRRRSLGNRLLVAMAQELPLCRFARRSDNWNDPQLLPKLGDPPQHCSFRHFPAERMLQRGNRRVSRLKLLVGLHRQLRHLARTSQLRATAPVAVSAQRIHIRQNPACHHIVRVLTRLALKVQAHRHIVRFQANQQLFGKGDVFGIGSRIPLTGYGFNK